MCALPRVLQGVTGWTTRMSTPWMQGRGQQVEVVGVKLPAAAVGAVVVVVVVVAAHAAQEDPAAAVVAGAVAEAGAGHPPGVVRAAEIGTVIGIRTGAVAGDDEHQWPHGCMCMDL
jgi:hypothetical protein